MYVCMYETSKDACHEIWICKIVIYRFKGMFGVLDVRNL